jgi:tetratricopeptide (TPR) repeat protein
VPLLAIGAAVVLAITTSALAPPRHEASPELRLATAITNYWTYVGKLLWPERLAVFYPQVPAIAAWKVVAALLALAGVSVALLALRRRLGAGPLVGWLWYLGTMVPTAGIVRSGLWPGMADRFMYFPMIGLLVALVWLAAPAFERGRRGAMAGAALAAAIAVGLGVRSHRYARVWRESETLFREAVEQTDGATVMRANLGKALDAKGRTAEAWAVFQELARIAPDLPDGWVNMGRLLHEAGDLDGAEAHYARALAVAPSFGEAMYDLALIESARGRHAEAAQLYDRAIRAGFSSADAWNHLGSSYAAIGRVADAEAAFGSALARDEAHWHAAVNLAVLLDRQGRGREAASAMAEGRARAARAGEPGAPDAAVRALSGGARP